MLTLDLRATGSSGSTLGFLGPSSSSSEDDSSSAEGIGDSAILYWNGRVVFKAVLVRRLVAMIKIPSQKLKVDWTDPTQKASPPWAPCGAKKYDTI